MARSAILVGSLVAALLVAPGRADACSCYGGDDPEGELAASDAVFVGKIASIQREARRQIVLLTVTRAFKGVANGATVEVHTGTGGGDCGIRFGAASSWLVYASRSGGIIFDEDPKYAGLRTIACSGTTMLEKAAPDIAKLTALTSGKAKASAKAASSSSSAVPAATTSDPPATSAPPATDNAPPRASTDAPTPVSSAADAGKLLPVAAPPAGSKGCACEAGRSKPWSSLDAFGAAFALLAAALRRRRT